MFALRLAGLAALFLATAAAHAQVMIPSPEYDHAYNDGPISL
jgi:hypothetical protein